MGKSFTEINKEQLACKCGADMVHDEGGPGSTLMERLDNGFMPRAVNRIADIDRIMKDRKIKADPLAGKKNFT